MASVTCTLCRQLNLKSISKSFYFFTKCLPFNHSLVCPIFRVQSKMDGWLNSGIYKVSITKCLPKE